MCSHASFYICYIYMPHIYSLAYASSPLFQYPPLHIPLFLAFACLYARMPWMPKTICTKLSAHVPIKHPCNHTAMQMRFTAFLAQIGGMLVFAGRACSALLCLTLAQCYCSPAVHLQSSSTLAQYGCSPAVHWHSTVAVQQYIGTVLLQSSATLAQRYCSPAVHWHGTVAVQRYVGTVLLQSSSTLAQ
jgi:hypothetical protein